MRCFLRLAAIAILAGSAFANTPSISISVRPTEPDAAGNLIYARIGAPNGAQAATGRFWFTVRVSNISTLTDLTISRIEARLATGGIAIVYPFNRAIPLDRGTVKEVALEESEIITIPATPPDTAEIRVFCLNYTDPVSVTRPLAAYVAPVPGGQYVFHAEEGDIGPNEYFAGGTHAPPHGQGWGTDWRVYRIDANNDPLDYRVGGTNTINADAIGWGVPIRALAAGTVLRVSTGWVDNPQPGVRALQNQATVDAEPIHDVKVTRLGPAAQEPTAADPARGASLTRLAAGNFQLSVWQIDDRGFQLTRLGSSLPAASADLVTDIAIDELADDPQGSLITRVVTAFRLTTGNLRAVVWNISADGLTITRGPELDWALGDFSEMSVVKMSATRFAIAVRDVGGNLRVSVWEIDAGGVLRLRASDTAGGATSVSVTSLSDTRIAAACRASNGNLKLIAWDFSTGPFALTRKGDAEGDPISRVVATNSVQTIDDTNIATCITTMRTSAGFIRVVRWVPADVGNAVTLTPEGGVTGQAITNTALAACRASDDAVASLSLLAGGVLKINGWGPPEPDETPPITTFQFSAQNEGPAADRISLDETSHVKFLVGTRTPGGNLRMAVWHWAHGGGNSLYVLHGNCRVLYAHFREGSVNTNVLFPGATVSAGQILGRMGNSGAAGDVHTHIHSDRFVEPLPTLQEMLDLHATGDPDTVLIGPRPIPFHGARAMRLGDIVRGGESSASNSFTTLTGQGTFNPELGIRPRNITRYVVPGLANIAPNGFKDMLPNLNGGPWSTLATGLSSSPVGARLYLRGGSYQENVLFNKAMIIRRYDYYDADGSVLIQR